jgi:hypothetical protein
MPKLEVIVIGTVYAVFADMVGNVPQLTVQAGVAGAGLQASAVFELILQPDPQYVELVGAPE